MEHWKANLLKWQLAAFFASKHRDKVDRRRVFYGWRGRTNVRGLIREDATVRDATARLEFGMMRRCFEGWRQVTARSGRLDILLQVAEVRGQERRLKWGLQVWRGQFARLRLDVAVAEAKSRRWTLRRFIAKWRIETRDAVIQREALIRLRHARLTERQKRILRAWAAYAKKKVLLNTRLDVWIKERDMTKMAIVISSWRECLKGRAVRIVEQEYIAIRKGRLLKRGFRSWRRRHMGTKADRFLALRWTSRCWHVWREQYWDAYYDGLSGQLWRRRVEGVVFYRWMWRYRHRSFGGGDESIVSEVSNGGDLAMTKIVRATYEKISFEGNPSEYLRMNPLERVLQSTRPQFLYQAEPQPPPRPSSSPSRALQPKPSPNRKPPADTLTTLFNHWHTFAERRKVDLQRADAIHIAHLKYRFIKRWRQKFWEMVKLARLASQMRALWNARLGEMEDAETWRRAILVGWAVRVWKARLDGVRRMESGAEVVWRWNVMERWFGIWMVRKEVMGERRVEEEVVRFIEGWREKRVLRVAFGGFLEGLRRRREERLEAEEGVRRMRIGRVFVAWRDVGEEEGGGWVEKGGGEEKEIIEDRECFAAEDTPEVVNEVDWGDIQERDDQKEG
ncbi:hypothetical protein HDV00_007234 [Rhizophlyctis rosea]|nr:hypothetical protein HDV00_007234 [Rhizophlyctis rosea]